MTEQQALDAIKAVADKTTEIGVAVGKEGDTLAAVKKEIQDIIAGESGTVPDSVAAALSALLPSVQGVSDNLGTHEQILTDILAAGKPPVPPTPVPDPTPAP